VGSSEKFDARVPDFSTSCCLIPLMRPTPAIDAGDQSKVSRSTVERLLISDSKVFVCIMGSPTHAESGHPDEGV
jgi:hypothetical protein